MFSRTRANVSNFLSTWQPEWVSSPGLKEWLVFWTLEIIATFFRFEEAVTSVWRTEIYFIGTAISPVNIRQNVGDYTWSCSGGYVSTLVWLVYCFASTLSYSYFLHSKNLDLPDCVWLLLDHNALLSCNHNALWHLTSYRHVLHEFFCTQKKPLIRNFTISGLVSWEVYQCWVQKHSNHQLCWLVYFSTSYWVI